MSPFDIAVFALPNSFIIALLPGLSGIASPAVTDFPMFSPVQAIIAADAGLIVSTAAIAEAANRTFILFLPSSPMLLDNDSQAFRKAQFGVARLADF